MILVAYDVNTETAAGRRRLRRMARACKDYGQRVQKSIFECKVGDAEWAELKHRLVELTDSEKDSLRLYYIDEAACRRTEHYGVGEPADLGGPLIA